MNKKIKNNFKCLNCKGSFYYSPSYCSEHIYCEDCINKKEKRYNKLIRKIIRKAK